MTEQQVKYNNDDEYDNMCPVDGCENKQNLQNKKGRCNECQTWWYETKRTFFGRERRCVTCKIIFEPETRDETRDKVGYICENCA